MPKVSVVIPTHNRPDLLRKAIASVLAQTYQDFDVIVVDDGLKERAESVVADFRDSRIRYIQHDSEKGGGAARNTGIKAANAEFIAFLDDDDEWFTNKLEVQTEKLVNTPSDLGFCFSQVVVSGDEGEEMLKLIVNESGNYFETVLSHFSGFTTTALVVKKSVFEDVGYFDESLPSHQETDLLIRITRKYRGVAVTQPLAKQDDTSGHEHIGSHLDKRIMGRELILKKYLNEFQKRPRVLAKWYFGLGLYYRDNAQLDKARLNFKKAMSTFWQLRYLLHYLSMMFGGKFYTLVKSRDT